MVRLHALLLGRPGHERHLRGFLEPCVLFFLRLYLGTGIRPKVRWPPVSLVCVDRTVEQLEVPWRSNFFHLILKFRKGNLTIGQS